MNAEGKRSNKENKVENWSILSFCVLVPRQSCQTELWCHVHKKNEGKCGNQRVQVRQKRRQERRRRRCRMCRRVSTWWKRREDAGTSSNEDDISGDYQFGFLVYELWFGGCRIDVHRQMKVEHTLRAIQNNKATGRVEFQRQPARIWNLK